MPNDFEQLCRRIAEKQYQYVEGSTKLASDEILKSIAVVQQDAYAAALVKHVGPLLEDMKQLLARCDKKEAKAKNDTWTLKAILNAEKAIANFEGGVKGV